MNKEINIDPKTVAGFGDEWVRFDQSELSEKEHRELFDNYFSIFPWHLLPKDAVGFDAGCGTGRWAKVVAQRVERLHCIEPSAALDISRKNLMQYDNCEFHNTSIDEMSIEEGSMDFGYSLGVLHHIPDTQAGIEACVQKLKIGAPLLLYLYYAFDNRPRWFQAIWRLSNIFRSVISSCPYGLRYFFSQVIASLIYFPVSRFSWVMEKTGFNVNNIPLSAYRKLSFYTMRTDALDRFGTRLEKRFSREQIKAMMEKAGLERVKFSENIPFWCAVGYRSAIKEVHD